MVLPMVTYNGKIGLDGLSMVWRKRAMVINSSQKSANAKTWFATGTEVKNFRQTIRAQCWSVQWWPISANTAYFRSITIAIKLKMKCCLWDKTTLFGILTPHTRVHIKLSYILVGRWMTDKGWIKGTANQSTVWQTIGSHGFCNGFSIRGDGFSMVLSSQQLVPMVFQ